MSENTKKNQNAKELRASLRKQQRANTSQIFYSTLSTLTISTLTFTIAMVIDGIIIGQFLGTNAIAAYGFAMPLLIAANAVFGVFATGVQSVCGNCMGRGDMKSANGYFNATLIVMVGISALLIAVIVIFQEPLAIALGANGEGEDMQAILSDTKGYLVGFAFGVIFQFGGRIISPFMQLDNDRGKIVPAAVCGSCVNIGGDLVNVFFLNWGMFGMAMATSVSFIVELAFLSTHFFKKDINYKINPALAVWKGWSKVVVIGLPTAVQALCSTGKGIFMNYGLLALAGSIGVAAFSIQSNSQNVFGCVTIALGVTVLMLANIFEGEEDNSALKGLFQQGIFVSISIVAIIAVALFIFAPQVAMLYSTDAEVLGMATDAIRFYAVGLILYGISQTIQNFSQGTKKIGLTMVICVMCEFAFVVLSALILSQFFGVYGYWASFPVAQILTIFAYFIIVVIKNKSFKLNFDKILLLPKSFEDDSSNKFEFTASDVEGVMMSSFGAEVLCQKHDIDKKRTNAISLCVEEMAMNIVENGIKDEKQQRIDVKVMIKGEDIIIRLRDNCPAVNPIDHFKKMSEEDPFAAIGIKMVMELAKDVNYISTMKLNNLIITI